MKFVSKLTQSRCDQSNASKNYFSEPAQRVRVATTHQMHTNTLFILRALSFAGLAAIAYFYMYYKIFSAYAPYDDEGYMLLTLKDFFAGHALYDEIYAIYGPFYYFYYWMLWIAGLVVPTHDSGRLVTAAHWMIASGLFGYTAKRFTGQVWIGCLVFIFSVLHLTPITGEPTHPQGLVLTIMGVFALTASLRWSDLDAHPRRLMLLGLLTGALIETKINVGIFSYLGIVCALSPLFIMRLAAKRPVLWTALASALTVGAMTFPMLLMRQLIVQQEWVWGYCAVSITLNACTMLITLHAAQQYKHDLGLRAFTFVHLGLVTAIAGSIGFILYRGSTLDAIWRHIIVVAMKLPDQFQVPNFQFTTNSLFGALLAFCLAFYWTKYHQSFTQRMNLAFGGLKIVIASGAFYCSWYSSGQHLVPYFAPWLWLVLVRPVRAPNTLDNAWGRVVLLHLSVFHILQAYPVFGTQGALSSVLFIPIYAIVLHDGLKELAPFRIVREPLLRHRYAEAFGVCLLLVSFGAGANITGLQARYENRYPINMAGAERVRLDADTASELTWLVNNLQEHADTFVLLPGMYSFYLWTGQPTPTTFNAEIWTYELTDEQQMEIVESLKQQDRVCAILSPKVQKMWQGSYDAPETPLTRYIREEFVPIMKTASYTFCLRASSKPQETYNVLLRNARDFGAERRIVPLPRDLALSNGPFTLELEFLSTEPGALLGQQVRPYPTTPVQNGWRPIAYLGNNGKLHIAAHEGGQHVIVSPEVLADGKPHHLTLVADEEQWTAYVDGVAIGSAPPPNQVDEDSHWQLGDAYTVGFPEATDGWFPYEGLIGEVHLHRCALNPIEVATHAESALERNALSMTSATASATITTH